MGKSFQSDLCAGFAVHSGKYQKIKSVKWQMISFEWRQRLTCHRLHFRLHLGSKHSYGTFNLPTVFRVNSFFCVSHKLICFHRIQIGR